MNKKIGFLFAGQGSQYIGMGKDIYDNFDYVREMFKEANSILGYNLEDIIFQENDLINQTKYTQASVLVTTCAIYEVIKRELGIKPIVNSGFSLGEYSALYSSGIFSFKDIVKLVNYRAMFMEEAATKNSGSMAAIIGLDESTLNKLCEEVKDVAIANYNSPSQLVISGLKNSVLKVCERVKLEFGKRAIPLNVSGGFHSFLMKDAGVRFSEVLNNFTPNAPTTPIIMNYNAKPLELNDLFNAMTKQIYSPVYFTNTVYKMINEYNVDCFVEIGPGKVLSGLVKKTDNTKKVINFEKLQDILDYKESM